MKYKVTFEFRNCLGKWINDELADNGEGFSYEDARRIRTDLILAQMPTRNVEVIEL